MKITRQDAAHKLTDYLYHNISLEEVVEWAEWVMMEADFEDRDFEVLREIVSRLGLADVKAFGITWEDCEDFLDKLGYCLHITVSEAEAAA